jgi:hypothetical protein
MKTVILSQNKKIKGRGLVEAGLPVTIDTVLADIWIDKGVASLPTGRSTTSPPQKSQISSKIDGLRASIVAERDRVGDVAFDKVIGGRRPDLLKDVEKLGEIYSELKTLPDAK